jgi:PAS domain S-box-containing protein
LEVVLKGITDGITVQGPDGQLLYANDAAARIVGFDSAKEMINTPVQQIIKNFTLFDENFKPFPVENLPGRVALQGRESGDLTLRFKILATGEERWSQVKAVPVFDEHGKVRFAINIFRDVTNQKRAEIDIKDSRERWRSLAMNAPDIIFTCNHKGTIEFINRTLPGLKVEEIIGKSAFSFVPSRNRKVMKNALDFVFRTGKATSYEIKAPRPDGTEAWYTSRVGAIKREGKVDSVVVIATDVTQSKVAEAALRKAHTELELRVERRTGQLRKINESLKREIKVRRRIESVLAEEKRKMEVIYKTTQEGLTLYDRQGKVVYINPSLKRLFGVKKSIVGVPREEIVKNRKKYFKYSMERSDDSLKTQQEVYKGRSVSNVLMKLSSRPERFIEANYTPIKGRSGKVYGMIGSFRDVTVLKKQSEKIAEQLIEVQKQKDKWEAIFEHAEEGIYLLDRNFNIVQVNSSFELMHGFSEEEVLARKSYDVLQCQNKQGQKFPEFHPADIVLKTKEPLSYDEHIHIDKYGKERWVGVSYSPLFDKRGEIEQILVVARDITALKDLDRAKSEFVSMASHELRTPLTVVNGYLSLLLNGDLGAIGDSSSKATFQAVLTKVYGETKRLTKLVEELLNVSRIEEGRLKLTLRRVSVPDVLAEVSSEFRNMASDHGIKLEVKENGSNMFTKADKDKLKQILVNLFDNAIKFTNPGGEVLAEYYVKDDHIFVSIKDSGLGIPADMCAKVFDKFKQIGSLKDNKGAGLGLFIVKSLVEMHRGKIWVESKVGKGSNFIFTLPLLQKNETV